MKEFRLTFAAEDFAVVSQALVAMGVSFHVEPVASAPRDSEIAESQAPSVPKAHGPAKGVRKPPAARKTKQSKPEPTLAATAPAIGGADRLREAIARSGNAYRSVMESAKITGEAEAASSAASPNGPGNE